MAVSKKSYGNFCFPFSAVWGVEPDETHQTFWLESTGGVPHNELVRTLLKEEPNVPLLIIWAKQRKMLPPDDAVKSAECCSFYCLHCAMPNPM